MGVRKLTGIIAETMPAINSNAKVQFSAGLAKEGRKIASGARNLPVHAPPWSTNMVRWQKNAPRRRNAPQKREPLRAPFGHGDVAL
jgi:hypothetical protein